MRRKLSLSFLTCHGASPEESTRAVAAAGYDYVGLRFLPATPGGIAFPLMDEPARLQALRSLLSDTGIGVLDVEMIRLAPDFAPEPFLPFLDAAAEIGARTILVAGDDPDETRLSASFVSLCEAAAGFGLWIDLEFMPQSDLRDLAGALRILRAADQSNQGVIIDTLHVSRARVTPDEIAAVPSKWLHYAQICDAPAELPTTRAELNHAARHERLLPGDGGIDLKAIFDALPRDLPVAVEVPHDAQAKGLSVQAWAEKARHAALGLLDLQAIEEKR